MEYAARRATLEFRLRQQEFSLSSRLVTQSDRRLHPFHEGADTADTAGIDVCAPRIAANTLLSGNVMRHASISVDSADGQWPIAEGPDNSDCWEPPSSRAERDPERRHGYSIGA